MNNKKTLKNILEEKINQQKIYENILKKQKEQHTLKKWLVVPVCLALIGLFVFPLKNTEKNFKVEEVPNFTNNSEQNTNSGTDTNQEPTKNFTYSETNSTMEDTIYRFVETKEDLQIPYFTSALPKDLKLSKNQKVYYKEDYIGDKQIYESTESYRIWMITYYKNQKMEEKEEMPKINNLKYQLTETIGHISVHFNYNERKVSLWTINITKEEIMDFLKSI